MSRAARPALLCHLGPPAGGWRTGGGEVVKRWRRGGEEVEEEEATGW